MATTLPTSDDVPRAKSVLGVWLWRFEAWLERTGERLNPILVKECRQALKGRQFLVTFTLVLLCCWLWSIWGVISIGPSINFGAGMEGMKMFAGYFVILAFPLLVIVPHGAFRSLADERDDRTYDLLSITTLGPRQIVAGKLGSAAVQMLVYMSAVSPCLAFTYLLRGIEAPTILVALGYTLLASLGLSILAILAGTLTAERAWQTLWSVVIVIGLLFAFFMAMMGTFGLLLEQRLGFDNRDFWYGNAMLLIAYISYFALFFLAAAARLTFVSENRSTPLRIVMFAQPILLLLCFAWSIVHLANIEHREAISGTLRDVMRPFFFMLAIHWSVMGVFMEGELPRLSNRARRRLPQSFLGRAFFTWFNPGPGTGYLFALANLLSGLLIVLGTAAYLANTPPPTGFGMSFSTRFDVGETAEVCVLMFGYVAFYLGLGKLLISLARRIASVGIVLSVLLQLLLLLTFCGMPRVIESLQQPQAFSPYTLLNVFDPFMTLGHERDLYSGMMPAVMLIVLGAAFVLFLVNLRGVVQEIRQVRVAKPARVAEEDAALKAPFIPPAPRSPWD